MPSALLAVDQLRISHNGQVILPPTSFEIFPGEVLAITGASGSGKTSIALALLGMLPPALMQSGEITWNGRMQWSAHQSQWPSLRGIEIAFIPQDVYGAFDPIMTIGKQLSAIIQNRTAKTSEEVRSSLKQAMAEVGLQDTERLWRSFPHQLSGGQLQRCQICLAMVLQPKLIIADEPTAAIDKINQQELLDVLLTLKDNHQVAILCITHDSGVVNYIADREITLGTGQHIVKKIWQKHSRHTVESPVLDVSGLAFTHRYGGLIDKRGATAGPVSFTLYGGSCLGIIGESGSGKSTVAQLLTGLHLPAAGEIRLNSDLVDLHIRQQREKLRWQVQLVLQDGRGSLHPHHTVQTTLQEVARNRKSKPEEVQRQVERVLEAVRLPKSVLSRKPATLSGGESLRVSIARALIMDPHVLICDESTSALDETTRDEVLELLKTLVNTRTMALILITHDLQVLREMADEILVMANGKAVEYGLAADLLDHPKSPVTQKILTSDATLARKRTPLP